MIDNFQVQSYPSYSYPKMCEVRTSTSHAGSFVYDSIKEILKENEISNVLQTTTQRFNTLVATWKHNSLNMSSINQMALDPNYLQIIALGNNVLPLLLQELKRDPDYWFIALSSLTNGVDPIKNENRGNLLAMTNDWLNWAEQNNYYVA